MTGPWFARIRLNIHSLTLHASATWREREREAVALSTPPSGISPSPNEFYGFRRLILGAKSSRDFLAWNVLLTVAIEWFQLNKLRGVKYIALLFIFWIDLL